MDTGIDLTIPSSDPHAQRPERTPVSLGGNDARFIYRTVVTAAENALETSLNQSNVPLDNTTAKQARQHTRHETNKALELARHALVIDGSVVTDAAAFRATFGETAGVEPVDEALASKAREMVDLYNEDAVHVAHLRGSVPGTLTRHYEAWAAKVEEFGREPSTCTPKRSQESSALLLQPGVISDIEAAAERAAAARAQLSKARKVLESLGNCGFT